MHHLISAAIPLLVPLIISGVLALLAYARNHWLQGAQSKAQLALLQLDLAVDAALHAVQPDLSTLAQQVAAGKLTAGTAAKQALSTLKSRGWTAAQPALDAAGEDVEALLSGLIARKLGLTLSAAPVPPVPSAP